MTLELIQGLLLSFAIVVILMPPYIRLARHFGMAKQIRTKTGPIPIQYRLTALDALWHNERLAVFVTIMAAVLTTSLGAYRLRKEFKR